MDDLAPDYDSDIQSNSQSDSQSIESLDNENSICDLCLRGGGIMINPGETCVVGIQTAHVLCFEEYRRSWPIDHPNRKQCPICREDYSIQENDLVDMSQRRKDAYSICLYIVVSSNLFSTYTFATNSYDISYFFYSFLLYFIIDFILISISASRIKQRMRANLVIHTIGIILIYIGTYLSNMRTFLWISSLILHALMSKRLCYKYAELKI